MYVISLNPKKCLFAILEGKLLQHIVSKEGIYIDLERIKSINGLNPPTSRKGVQYLFGKINLNKLLKKDRKLQSQSISY
jgi:hypothetical protein